MLTTLLLFVHDHDGLARMFDHLRGQVQRTLGQLARGNIAHHGIEQIAVVERDGGQQHFAPEQLAQAGQIAPFVAAVAVRVRLGRHLRAQHGREFTARLAQRRKIAEAAPQQALPVFALEQGHGGRIGFGDMLVAQQHDGVGRFVVQLAKVVGHQQQRADRHAGLAAGRDARHRCTPHGAPGLRAAAGTGWNRSSADRRHRRRSATGAPAWPCRRPARCASSGPKPSASSPANSGRGGGRQAGPGLAGGLFGPACRTGARRPDSSSARCRRGRCRAPPCRAPARRRRR